MSELRKRKEREKTKAFKEEQKKELRESAWWNTSSGLRAKCQGIEHSHGWSVFLTEYDKSEHQERRLEEWHLSRTWKGISPDLLSLIDLAENATKHNADAGKKLGLTILRIINGGKEFNEFIEGVKLRRKRESGVSEAAWALKCFAEREELLPTRDELNREAYLLKNLKVREISMIEWLREHSRFEVFHFGHRLGDQRIYWMQLDEESGQVRIHTYHDRENSMKPVRWPNESTFSEVLGKAGLRGLI